MTTTSPADDASAWLHLAEELAGVGFWRMNPATGVVDWSPHMFRLFEFPPGVAPRAEETMSRIHPDDRAAAYVDLSANLQEGRHVSISRIMLRSGGVRIVESHTSVQRDHNGEIVAIVGSVLDVTGRTLHERQPAMRPSTEQDTAHATTLSHEIRTPLMAVIGYSHLLAAHKALPPEARRDVELVEQSSKALLSVANSVLGQSRGAATIGETELASVALGTTVQRVLDLFAGPAERKGLELVNALDPTVPPFLNVHADAIMQILVNLVGNAVKFTDRGEIRVSASYNDAMEVLTFSVEDTGQGFDDATRYALFRRFSRVADGLQIQSGAGLGLSICKGLVDALGGSIDVVSELGAGARFTVSLPASHGCSPDVGSVITSGAVRVLVIDDHPAVAEICRRVLEAAGVHLDSASDGASALSLAHAQPYDLILVDLNLPDMSGLDVAKAIRREGPNVCSRLVAFTASEVDVRRLPSAFDAYVGKPIHPDQLVALARAKPV